MKTNCETCGKVTKEWEQHYIEESKKHPIYGADFSIPLSELVESLRRDLANIRGKFSDICSAFPRWENSIKNIEGLLTCGLIVSYNLRKEMYEVENPKTDQEKILDVVRERENKKPYEERCIHQGVCPKCGNLTIEMLIASQPFLTSYICKQCGERFTFQDN